MKKIIIQSLFNKKSNNNIRNETGFDQLARYFGTGIETYSGESISQESSLKFSCVYACVNLRANTIAKMPLYVYKRTPEGKERVDNSLSYALNVRPNPNMTPFAFKHTISSHIDLWGNAYVYFEIKNGKYNLWILNPWEVVVLKDPLTGVVTYSGTFNSMPKTFLQKEILHFKALSIDGLSGRSRITMARETLGNIQASQRMLGGFYKNGTASKGIITYPDPLNKNTKTAIRDDWQEINSGLENVGKVAILDNGLDYKSIGMSFEDAQYLQLAKFNIEEICRIFNVPLHMVGMLDRSTFNNIQQQSIDYISNSIQPTITDIEEEGNYKLFSSQQSNQGYYIKFNMAVALRADDEARSNYYEKMLNLGAYNIDEVRELEDKNPLPNGMGSKYRVSLNSISLEVADKYQLNKSGQSSKGGENIENTTT